MTWAKIILVFVLAFWVAGAAAQDNSRQFKPHKFNGTKPAYSGGVWSFELQPQGCSARKYGDGRGESDCFNGSLRSRIRAPKLASPGQQIEYYMEIRVDPSFRYDGGRTPAWSKLEVAEWGRTQGIKNHIYDLQLDTKRGLTFERKVCIKPSELGNWNSFRLRVKWSKSGDGYLEAMCNGRIILQRLNQQTVIPPDCAAPYKLQCDPARQIPDSTIYWQVGPKLSGFGPNYAQLGRSSRFAAFPKSGVRMQVRKLYAGRPVKR